MAQFESNPSWNWKTIDTGHFRVHYPAPFEEWTVEISSKMEFIHERVTGIIGSTPEDPVDVVVMDPMAVSNGMALPLLRMPRIILWATAPDTSSAIGALSDWGELVFSHEYAHIVHLIRPPHNPWKKFLTYILPVGPVAWKVPNWVAEGYATFIEGELTGSGRPQGSIRATIIRQWAVEGKLPEYRELDGSDEWMSGAMPYLVGSTYLEWLQRRSGDPDCFKNLWKRLSARTDRSFEEAFTGVFQDSPDDLYDRFTPEMTLLAMNVESEIAVQGRIEGEKWQDMEGLSAMALSPDGKEIAVVLQPREKPVRLAVWSTTE